MTHFIRRTLLILTTLLIMPVPAPASAQDRSDEAAALRAADKGFRYVIVERDFTAALPHLREALDRGAEQWLPEGSRRELHHFLGLAYMHSASGRDLDRARRHLSRAEELGLPVTLHRAQLEMIAGRDQAAVRLLRQVAREDDPSKLISKYDPGEALRILGQFHLEGRGVPVDTAAAIRLFQRSDDGDAKYLLSRHYYYGAGVAQDRAKAYAYAKEGVSYGSGDALTLLGIMYYNGDGTRQDQFIGKFALCLAADGYLMAGGGNELAAALLRRYQIDCGFRWADYSVDDIMDVLKIPSRGR